MPITPVINEVPTTALLDDGREMFNQNDTNLKNAIVSLSTTVDGLPTTVDLTTHKNSGDHDAHNDDRYAPLSNVQALTDHKSSADHDAHNDARYAPLSSVTPTKRRRMMITFSFGTAGRAVFNSYDPTGIDDPTGIPMLYGGCIVGFAVVNANGGVTRKTANYMPLSDVSFRVGDVISALDIGTDCYPTINNAAINVLNLTGTGTNRLGAIVLELDDDV